MRWWEPWHQSLYFHLSHLSLCLNPLFHNYHSIWINTVDNIVRKSHSLHGFYNFLSIFISWLPWNVSEAMEIKGKVAWWAEHSPHYLWHSAIPNLIKWPWHLGNRLLTCIIWPGSQSQVRYQIGFSFGGCVGIVLTRYHCFLHLAECIEL